MFRFIKEMFIILLTSLVNASSHTKCVSLSNQKCEIQPTLTVKNTVKNFTTSHLRLN